VSCSARGPHGVPLRAPEPILLVLCATIVQAVLWGLPSPVVGAAAALHTVRLTLSTASSSNAGVYVADGLGYFATQGLRVEILNLGGSASEFAAALATDRVDIADVGVNPAMFNTVKAGGFKVVADKGALLKGWGYVSIIVRKDFASRIKGPEDLKGLSIAMTPPGLATANGFALSVYLARASLKPEDVHIQPIPFPAQMAALSNKAVPVAMMTEPFATQAIKSEIGVRLITADEIVPGQQVGTIAYGSRFLATHRDWAEQFMIAYIRGIRAYNAAMARGVEKAQIIQILTQWTPIKDAGLWAEMIPAGLNPTGKLNVESIQQAENFFHQLGLVPEPPALGTFIDHSFVDHANQVLGPPVP
jgi:ABC-type nitrate/sulfonate/bicarbonate transport system substrate-binding protein